MEDDEFLVFKDINPKAPVHFLVIPKKHLGPVDTLSAQDSESISNIILKAKSAAELSDVAKSGYRLVFNVGRDAGMEVNHLHLHFLAGKLLKM